VKAYIGAKVIKAEPQKREETGDGQLIIHEGYRIVYPDGYVSWSPKATFEQAYRELDVHERALVAEGR
jgi:hypothetical protein